MKKFPGKLFIISGPSRIGKDIVVRKLLQLTKLKLNGVITYTTRVIRPGEKPGREHHFITATKFQAMAKNKKFLEWHQVHKERYGTPTDRVIKHLNRGRNVLLNIDVQGAAKIKKQIPQAILIFITAESKREIKRRIFSSPQLTLEQKNIRWHNAQQELKVSKKYDYLIVNRWGKLPETLNQIKKIILHHLKLGLTKI